MRYELIREIFNLCSGNQMRDVFVSEAETADTDEYIREYCRGREVTIDKSIDTNGVAVYDIENDGLRQRLTFTPDD